MSTAHNQASASGQRRVFTIRTLKRDELIDILALGWRDFTAAPLYGLFFGGIYGFGGLCILALVFYFNAPYIGYPKVAGFALIAPFVAAGTYEISRRLERNEPLAWSSIFGAVWHRGGKELGWMALVTVFSLIIWVDFAVFLFLMFFGLHIPTLEDLITILLTTEQGLIFIIIGHCAGFIFASLVFSITVISFPLLADQDVDFITAMITSVRSVLLNKLQMTAWAVLIALLLSFSILSCFIGLCVILPILGHATWHLYRRLIV